MLKDTLCTASPPGGKVTVVEMGAAEGAMLAWALGPPDTVTLTGIAEVPVFCTVT